MYASVASNNVFCAGQANWLVRSACILVPMRMVCISAVFDGMSGPEREGQLDTALSVLPMANENCCLKARPSQLGQQGRCCCAAHEWSRPCKPPSTVDGSLHSRHLLNLLSCVLCWNQDEKSLQLIGYYPAPWLALCCTFCSCSATAARGPDKQMLTTSNLSIQRLRPVNQGRAPARRA